MIKKKPLTKEEIESLKIQEKNIKELEKRNEKLKKALGK